MHNKTRVRTKIITLRLKPTSFRVTLRQSPVITLGLLIRLNIIAEVLEY